MTNELKKRFFDNLEEVYNEIPIGVNFVCNIQRKQGEYEGKAYDNVVLTTLTNYRNSDNELVHGVEHIKIKKALFDTMPCAVGDCVMVLYNRYGSVQDVHKL